MAQDENRRKYEDSKAQLVNVRHGAETLKAQGQTLMTIKVDEFLVYVSLAERFIELQERLNHFFGPKKEE